MIKLKSDNAIETLTKIALTAVEHIEVEEVEQIYLIAVRDILKQYPIADRDVAFTACLTFSAGLAIGKHLERMNKH